MSTKQKFATKPGRLRRINHDLKDSLIGTRNAINLRVEEINSKLSKPIKVKHNLLKPMNFNVDENGDLEKYDVFLVYSLGKRANGSSDPNKFFGNVVSPFGHDPEKGKFYLKGNTIHLKVFSKDVGLLLNFVELIEDVIQLHPADINEYNPKLYSEFKSIESKSEDFAGFEFQITFSSRYYYAEFDREKWIISTVEDFKYEV